jgi:hypothetical protein
MGWGGGAAWDCECNVLAKISEKRGRAGGAECNKKTNGFRENGMLLMMREMIDDRMDVLIPSPNDPRSKHHSTVARIIKKFTVLTPILIYESGVRRIISTTGEAVAYS